EFDGYFFDANTNMQVSEMTITNCGTSKDLYNQERGAVDFYAARAAIKNITFAYVDIVNAQRHGVQLGGSNGYAVNNIVFNNASINGTGADGITTAVFTGTCRGYAAMAFAASGTTTFNNLTLSNISQSPPTYKTNQAYNLVVSTTQAVSVTSMSVSPTSASLAVGAAQQLAATVAPSNATNKNVAWSTSNANVATVNSSGLVTAVAAGSATITATTQDGGKTATSAITVTSSQAAGTISARKVSTAPTINGSLSETTWNLTQTVGKATIGTPNNTVTFGVMWDAANLYVGAKVLDANLFSDSPDAWNDDAVEVYIDANNNKLTSYDGADNQIIKGYNKAGVTTKVALSGLQHAWAAISGGYSVELAIPWSALGISAPAAGTTIGFDLGYDDDDNGGDRDSQGAWNGTVNNYASTAGFGSLTLSSTAAREASALAATDATAPTLSYWPTPVTQELNIAADGSYQQVEVFDMLGRVHYRDATLAGQTALRLDLSQLAAGVYLVRLQGEQQATQFRTVKN
ncbi:MAG: T9SS type A sorting domain-containing protein, partial [Cytophagaceae bacterium]